jgi:hypothetical protein
MASQSLRCSRLPGGLIRDSDYQHASGVTSEKTPPGLLTPCEVIFQIQRYFLEQEFGAQKQKDMPRKSRKACLPLVN